MPPIPIHTTSPINAKTRQPSTSTTTDQPTSATTTSYPAARPGAPPFPAPTGTAATAYTPVQLSPTRTTQEPPYEGPPMPLPGAVPDVNATASTQKAAVLPPPPRAGEKTISTTTTAAPLYPSHPPAQLNIPPPTPNYLPTNSTTTASIPVFVAPMPLPISSTSPHTPTSYAWPASALDTSDVRRGSLEHPPGYVQNPRAADMTAAQREAQEMREKESAGGIQGVFQEAAVSAGGFLGGNASDGRGDVGDEGAWEKAKRWVGGVGDMVAGVEGEVWRRVGGGGK